MKRTLILVTAAAAALSLAATAGARPHSATLVIRHEVQHCHAWSLNGDAFKAAQKASLGQGGSLLVVDNDVMPHLLVQTGGPAKAELTRLASAMGNMATNLRGPGLMAHMGASVRATFPKAGTYTFRTKAGEDYMKGIVTKGEDNVLELTVVVA